MNSDNSFNTSGDSWYALSLSLKRETAALISATSLPWWSLSWPLIVTTLPRAMSALKTLSPFYRCGALVQDLPKGTEQSCSWASTETCGSHSHPLLTFLASVLQGGSQLLHLGLRAPGQMFLPWWRLAQMLCVRAVESESVTGWAHYTLQAPENKVWKNPKPTVWRVESKVNEGYRYVYSLHYLNNMGRILEIQSWSFYFKSEHHLWIYIWMSY